MSIRDFEGETFVAFLDICGFRVMMNNQRKAETTLDDFFRTVYEEVGMSRGRPDMPEVVDCIVVSDCAVAFARTENSERDDHLAPDWPSKETKRFVSMACDSSSKGSDRSRHAR